MLRPALRSSRGGGGAPLAHSLHAKGARRPPAPQASVQRPARGASSLRREPAGDAVPGADRPPRMPPAAAQRDERAQAAGEQQQAPPRRRRRPPQQASGGNGASASGGQRAGGPAGAAEPRPANRRPRAAAAPASAAPPPAASAAAAPPPNALDCAHFGACSGCTLAFNLERPPLAERAAAYFRQQLGYQGPFTVVAGPAGGWRCRAKLAVRGRAGAPVVGLFRARSHEAVDIPECRTHHPRINEAAALLRAALAAARLPPYSERRHAGLVRYCQLTALPSSPGARAEEDPHAQIQLVLVLNAHGPDHPTAAACTALASALWQQAGGGGSSSASAQPPAAATSPAAAAAAAAPAGRERLRLGGSGWTGLTAAASSSQQQAGGSKQQQEPAAPLLHSIWFNYQPAAGNTIFGREWQLVAGPEHGWQDFGGAAAAVGPGGFVQANYGAMQSALAAIAAAVPPDSRVAELYAGSGAIGLSLAAAGVASSVTCVELNPACRAPFEAARAVLPPDVAARASLTIASAGDDPGSWLAGADCVVVDPPRKGLDPALLQELVAPGSRNSGSSRDGGGGGRGGAGGNDAGTSGTGNCSSSGSGVGDTGSSGAADSVSSCASGSDNAGGSAAAPAAQQQLPGAPRRLVYLSCGYAALERDAAALLAGGWRVASACAFTFFPGTDHLETLAVFDRG